MDRNRTKTIPNDSEAGIYEINYHSWNFEIFCVDVMCNGYWERGQRRLFQTSYF